MEGSLQKKECINWWINNASLPSEELLAVIDVVCRKHRKSVSDYYNIDWARTEFQFGRVELERMRVRTQTPKDSTPQGSKYIVWIVGSKYKATRDDFVKYQIDRTIQRHLDFFYSQSVMENPSLSLKRSLKENAPDTGVSESKRIKIASSSSGALILHILY